MTIKISLSNKRFSFSLEKALDYINNRIDEKINLDDLLYFIKDGQVKTVIKIACTSLSGRLFLSSIGDTDYSLQPIFFIADDSLIVKYRAKNSRKSKGLCVYKNINGDCIYFCSSSPIQNRVMYKYPSINISFDITNSKRTKKINKFIYPNVDFSGWFYIEPYNYSSKEKDIIKNGKISIYSSNEFTSASNNDVEIKFKLTSESNGLYINLPNIEVDLDSIEILKKDLDKFLDLEQNIETNNIANYENQIKDLRNQLQIKNKKIEELNEALDIGNYPIFLNKFMENDRLALAIQARKDYWANYDPNLNNAPKAESTAREIKKKYDLSKKQAEAIEIIACPINRN
ncbi:MAG: hypothetical protein E6270_03225 [Haemophilus parainfluenzae]|nr:hypothetical protein [Haemophilus parainfluenzae]